MSKTNIVPISDQPASQEESPNRLSFTLEEMLKEFENGAVPRSKFWQELITALYDTANHVVTGVTAVADVKPDNIGNIPLLPKDIDAPAMVRMDGADANTQQTNQDVLGRSLFYGDACKVVHQYGAYYEVLAGEAYVAGIRFFYPGMQELLIEESDLPTSVWVDVSWPSDPMEERGAVVEVVVSDEEQSDYIGADSIVHYLEKIALIEIDSSALDLRYAQAEPVKIPARNEAQIDVTEDISKLNLSGFNQLLTAGFSKNNDRGSSSFFMIPEDSSSQDGDRGGRRDSAGNWWELNKSRIISLREFCRPGTQDNSKAIQEAFSLGCPIYVDDSFRCEGDIILSPGTSIIGSGKLELFGLSKIKLSSSNKFYSDSGFLTLDFSQRDAWEKSPLVYAEGTLLDFHYLAKDAVLGEKELSVTSASNLFKPGELLAVTSDKTWPGDTRPAQHGQYITVYDVSGDTVYTSQPLLGIYETSNNARIYKVRTIDDIHFERVNLIGQGRNPISSDGGDYGMFFEYCRNLVLKNIKLENIDEVACDLRSVYDFTVDNLNFEHGVYTHEEGERGAVQYQMRASDLTSEGRISNIRGTNSRHTFNTGHTSGRFGINSNIIVDGVFCKNTWHGGVSTHNSSQTVAFKNIQARGCESGINPRSLHMEVSDCLIEDCVQGIYFSMRPNRVICRDSKIIRSKNNGVLFGGNSVDADAIIDEVVFSNLTIDTCGENGIVLDASQLDNKPKVARLEHCNIYRMNGDGNEAGIRVRNFEAVEIIGCSVDQAFSGLRIENCDNVYIDATVKNCSYAGIVLVDCKKARVKIRIKNCERDFLISGEGDMKIIEHVEV